MTDLTVTPILLTNVQLTRLRDLVSEDIQTLYDDPGGYVSGDDPEAVADQVELLEGLAKALGMDYWQIVRDYCSEFEQQRIAAAMSQTPSRGRPSPPA